MQTSARGLGQKHLSSTTGYPAPLAVKMHTKELPDTRFLGATLGYWVPMITSQHGTLSVRPVLSLTSPSPC